MNVKVLATYRRSPQVPATGYREDCPGEPTARPREPSRPIGVSTSRFPSVLSALMVRACLTVGLVGGLTRREMRDPAEAAESGRTSIRVPWCRRAALDAG